ncbi:MAG: adenosylcobalamin-dependent ribonucleoside-diphosphate reductase [Spongiibacteraceae bacterium]
MTSSLSAHPFPMQRIARDVLQEKYLRAGENSIDDVYARIATALACAEASDRQEYYRDVFLQALRDGFIPGGRICANAGTALQSTLLNCFVQPISDSIAERTELSPGIYTALAEAAETMRRGGGVGYNFSALRPRGAIVSSTGALASGPLSYMDIFERSCVTLENVDSRRGAQMAVLDVAHPDIFDFIDAKREWGRFTTFNFSVGISDVFMRCVEHDGNFALVHKATPNVSQIANGAYRRDDGFWVYRTVKARQLWMHIAQAAYACAEPGVLFIDRVNRENNLSYCEHIQATNPCGEQPLPAYGSCCLGSLNLTAFVEHAFSSRAQFHFPRMIAASMAAVRMLDNVIDITPWPLPVQREVALATRRIGLGMTGLADALIMLGARYDSAAGRTLAANITETLRNTVYLQSIELAQERGPFPKFDAGNYVKAPFISRLPLSLQEKIQRCGIRNSHLLSIAPAGSISLAFADNVSSGIEPAFAWSYYRRKKISEQESQQYAVEDYAFRYFRKHIDATATLPQQFVDAWQINPVDHLLMAAQLAPYIDAGISKTINVPAGYPFGQFKDLYFQAWQLGLKGVTAFRANEKSAAVMSRLATDPSQILCDGCRI